MSRFILFLFLFSCHLLSSTDSKYLYFILYIIGILMVKSETIVYTEKENRGQIIFNPSIIFQHRGHQKKGML